jgi:hypothetical protein
MAGMGFGTGTGLRLPGRHALMLERDNGPARDKTGSPCGVTGVFMPQLI